MTKEAVDTIMEAVSYYKTHASSCVIDEKQYKVFQKSLSSAIEKLSNYEEGEPIFLTKRECAALVTMINFYGRDLETIGTKLSLEQKEKYKQLYAICSILVAGANRDADKRSVAGAIIGLLTGAGVGGAAAAYENDLEMGLIVGSMTAPICALLGAVLGSCLGDKVYTANQLDPAKLPKIIEKEPTVLEKILKENPNINLSVKLEDLTA